jgi:hypothetical protein
MRLFEINQELGKSTNTGINRIPPVEKTPVNPVKSSPSANIARPTGIENTLPHAVIFPGMNSFEFYRFVIAMASWPELDKAFFELSPMRDIPMAIATSDREFEMIKQVAKAVGKPWELLAPTKNANDPGKPTTGTTASPVMKFNMTEAQIDIVKALIEAVEADDPDED